MRIKILLFFSEEKVAIFRALNTGYGNVFTHRNVSFHLHVLKIHTIMMMIIGR